MNKKHTQRTKRHPLFTETDRQYLNGKKSRKSDLTSRFHRELDEHFKELLYDLDLLRRSPKLRLWRTLRAPRFLHYFNPENHFSDLFYDVEPIIYTSIIKRRKKGKGENRKYYYWQEPLPFKKIDTRILNSERMFNRFIVKPRVELKKLLLNAYDKKILPDTHEKAISEDEIKNILSDDEALQKYRDRETKKTKTLFFKSTPPDVDKIIVQKKKNVRKSLDKKLKKMGYKIGRCDITVLKITENEKIYDSKS